MYCVTSDARVKAKLIFHTPPLQYIQPISGGGRRFMSDSPLYNITCDFIKYNANQTFN